MPEVIILEVLAALSFFAVSFRESDGKETSMKVSSRFNISEKICSHATNKIWPQMVEKRRSEGMRTKYTDSPQPTSRLRYSRFFTFHSSELE